MLKYLNEAICLAGFYNTMNELIPLSHFYANRQAKWGYAPSYDGTRIAWYSVKKGRIVVNVARVDDIASSVVVHDMRIDNFSWHPYSNKLLLLSRNKLFKVDPLKPKRRHWKNITPKGLKNWRIERFPKSSEGLLILASNDRNPAALDLYTSKQDGSEVEILEENSDVTIGWLMDEQDKLKIRIDRMECGGAKYILKEGGEWRCLVETSFDENFTPASPPKDAIGTFFALSNRNRDRIALVKVDVIDGHETVIFEHDKVDVANIIKIDDASDEPDIVILEDSFPELHALTQKGENFKTLLFEDGKPADFQILGKSSINKFVTVSKSLNNKPFEYFLFDLESCQARKIEESFLSIHADKMVEMNPISFKARDDLEIAGFLTLPEGNSSSATPLVLKVHGGPALRDRWGYDSEIQFLVNRGYAVLTVNYRGSVGYGKAFQKAGHGQVGKAIQDDIVDAAKWAISEGIADENNIAIMGSSFGGYVAALAMTREPKLFKAAIIENAVTDIAAQMQNNPAAWGLHLDAVKSYFGNPEDHDDLKNMKENSPIYIAHNATGAMLVIAGHQDEIIKVQQSIQFLKVLQSEGKNVRSRFFKKEGHVFARWQSKFERARLIEKFLAKNLGGRDGGVQATMLVAKFLP